MADTFNRAEYSDLMYEQYRSKAAIVEVIMGQNVNVHLVTMPKVSEPDFYRSVSSYSAFSTYWLKRVWDRFAYSTEQRKRIQAGRYFNTYSRVEFETDRAFNAWLSTRGHVLPDRYADSTFIEHNSIWEFYNYINWDYKTKRFIKETA